MPYSGASDKSLPDYVKKMPSKKKKAWVATFNNVYNRCIDGGGSVSSCETKAFSIASGNAKKQTVGEQMAKEPITTRSLFNQVWGGFLTSLGIVDDEEDFELIPLKSKARIANPESDKEVKIRSTSMARLREQLYRELDNAEGGWAYPIDIFVGDNGKDLFSIVAQSGKLYQVPLSVSKDEVTLGEWVQVKEEFTPITQNSFSIRRQKDGTYRWFSIAGTTILNRDGEIDSSDLFDSFIERANKTGKYPRLDFYHQGSSDPDVWEFGTADYLARDGVCYIASGLFDKGHPLAERAIKACSAESSCWGNSIEFYAHSEPELILADPEVKIPVYKDGENTRISIVKEADAAGLFTRMGINEEVKRVMDKKTKEALKELFGEDEDGFKKFVEGSDSINRTVKEENLIHRKKKDADPEALEDEEDDEDTEAEDGEESNEDESPDLVIDDETVAVIAQQMTKTPDFKTLIDGIESVKQTLAEMVVAREKDQAKIVSLEKANAQLAQKIGRLSKEKDEEKREWQEDLPSKRHKTVTYRPRDVHDTDEDEDGQELDLESAATRTLSGLPRY